MGTADQYRARVDFCQRMAEKAIGEKARTTWLNLAAKALAWQKSLRISLPNHSIQGSGSVRPDKTGHFRGISKSRGVSRAERIMAGILAYGATQATDMPTRSSTTLQPSTSG